MVQRWFSRRALLFHFLLVVIAAGCLYAGWWQVHRAMSGNVLSYLYSVEWPAFAVVATIGWWQLIHEPPEMVEARREERRRRGQANPVAFDREVLRRELAAHPELAAVFPELAGAFPELAAGPGPLSLAAAGGTGDGAGRGGEKAMQPGAAVGEGRLPGREDPGEEAGVVGPGGVVVPTDRWPSEPGAAGDGAAERLRAYNDRLASLSAGGRRKSWRNPLGR